MATVTINPDLSASPSTVTINAGETVTWEGDIEFAIHLPEPHVKPNVRASGRRWSGTSHPFPGQAQKYTIHYTVSAGGVSADPDIEVLP